MTSHRITPGLVGVPDQVDVVVVGLGVTGAGIALDAISRRLTVLAVDAHDIAFGTSRWSSKLVHGGLRYLATGQVGIAHESAVERGRLMEVIAPHLVHRMPAVLPLLPSVSFKQAALTRAGFLAGDALRIGAGTSRDTLPRPRRISAAETALLVPDIQTEGLRGALMAWDGQLEDDARLVNTIARTAADRGAHVRTRARVISADGTGVVLRDEITGAETSVAARAVINAAGVWAGQVAPEITLRPSRGTHLVVRMDPSLPHVAIFAPVPGSTSRFVMVLPQPDGTRYVGLTDEPVEGPIPDVPTPSEEEIDFLLDVAGRTLRTPLTRDDIIGTYSGLRPLLDDGSGDTADLSRKHAVLTGPTGVITVVGGKLTTYRQMAEDAVDAAVAHAALTSGPCVTATLPLLGAASQDELARLDAPDRLVRRFGTDASLVLANARTVTGLSDVELLEPVAARVPATLAELVFGVTHEGAYDVDDLLDRRLRVGLIPEDRVLCVDAAKRALEFAGVATGD